VHRLRGARPSVIVRVFRTRWLALPRPGGGLVALGGIFAGPSRQGQELLRRHAQSVTKLGDSVQGAGAHGEVIQLHKHVAHLLIGVLQLLDLLLQRLDGILLPIPVGSLGKTYLCPPALRASVRDGLQQ